MRKLIPFSIITLFLFCPILVSAQTDQILNFDYSADGPWNAEENVNMTAPKVPNGSIQLDGSVSADEYGGFESIDVIPAETAWPLNWPPVREWDGPDDSSFVYYLAHDDDNFYIGVDVKDDVLSQDAAEATQFWQDDAIEVVIIPGHIIPPDTWGINIGVNGTTFDYGAHTYFTFNEKMRGIEEDGTDLLGQSFQASDWTFGPDGDITSAGSETDEGWMLEVKISKALMQGKEVEFPWFDQAGEFHQVDLNEDIISFAIGVDDDDAKLPDNTGFELQYWMPVKDHLDGFNMDEALTWSSEEIANGEHVDFYGVTNGSRLDGGSLGKLTLSQEVTPVSDWTLH